MAKRLSKLESEWLERQAERDASADRADAGNDRTIYQLLREAELDLQSVRGRPLPQYFVDWSLRAAAIVSRLKSEDRLPKAPLAEGLFAELGFKTLVSLARGKRPEVVGKPLCDAVALIDKHVDGKPNVPPNIDGDAPGYLRRAFWRDLGVHLNEMLSDGTPAKPVAANRSGGCSHTPLSRPERLVIEALLAQAPHEGRLGKQLLRHLDDNGEFGQSQSSLTTRIIPGLRKAGWEILNRRNVGYFLTEADRAKARRLGMWHRRGIDEAGV